MVLLAAIMPRGPFFAVKSPQASWFGHPTASVASDVSKGLKVFTMEGVKVKARVFYRESDLPWSTEWFRDEYVPIQDGAPSQTTKVTISRCKAHMAGFHDKDMWPTSGPKLKPMNFVIWAILERDMCATLHGSTAAQKLDLPTLWPNIAKGTVRRSCPSAVGTSRLL